MDSVWLIPLYIIVNVMLSIFAAIAFAHEVLGAPEDEPEPGIIIGFVQGILTTGITLSEHPSWWCLILASASCLLLLPGFYVMWKTLTVLQHAVSRLWQRLKYLLTSDK